MGLKKRLVNPIVGKKAGTGKKYKGSPLVDMRVFFRTIDWSLWWEEWALSVDEEGKPKYKTIRSFAKSHTKTFKQRKLIEWYLGRVDPEHTEYRMYSWISTGPVDWAEKRRTGGWCTPASMRVFNEDIERRLLGLDAMRAAGNRYTLNSWCRAEQLCTEIDKFFMQPWLPGLSYEQNVARMNTYMAMQEKALVLKEKAQDMYAKCHGIDFSDLQGVVQLMQSAVTTQLQTGGTELTADKKAIKSLVEMVVSKAHRYQLPLPEGAEQTIIEATAEVEDMPKSKKKSVN